MTTRERIYELAHNNSILSMCVYQAEHGLATWEEAMTIAAEALAIQNKVLFDQLLEMTKLSVPPPILMNCKGMNQKL